MDSFPVERVTFNRPFVVPVGAKTVTGIALTDGVWNGNYYPKGVVEAATEKYINALLDVKHDAERTGVIITASYEDGILITGQLDEARTDVQEQLSSSKLRYFSSDIGITVDKVRKIVLSIDFVNFVSLCDSPGCTLCTIREVKMASDTKTETATLSSAAAAAPVAPASAPLSSPGPVAPATPEAAPAAPTGVPPATETPPAPPATESAKATEATSVTPAAPAIPAAPVIPAAPPAAPAIPDPAAEAENRLKAENKTLLGQLEALKTEKTELEKQLSELKGSTGKLTDENAGLQRQICSLTETVKAQLTDVILGKKIELGSLKRDQADKERVKLTAMSVEALREVHSALTQIKSTAEPARAKLSDDESTGEKLTDEQSYRLKVFGHKDPVKV